MVFVTARCPYCTASIQVNSGNHTEKCRFCRKEFEVAQVTDQRQQTEQHQLTDQVSPMQQDIEKLLKQVEKAAKENEHEQTIKHAERILQLNSNHLQAFRYKMGAVASQVLDGEVDVKVGVERFIQMARQATTLRNEADCLLADLGLGLISDALLSLENPNFFEETEKKTKFTQVEELVDEAIRLRNAISTETIPENTELEQTLVTAASDFQKLVEIREDFQRQMDIWSRGIVNLKEKMEKFQAVEQEQMEKFDKQASVAGKVLGLIPVAAIIFLILYFFLG